jgi:predicted ATPase/DNA-binding winged helix-turn-helix (wHTH) protein
MKMTQDFSSLSQGNEVLTFGPFRLEPARHVLHEGNKRVRLGSHALEILIVLAEHIGQIVSKKELLARVWPKGIVQEATLRVHIAALRKALGDGEHGTRYVETFSGRGYRFVAEVIRRQENSSPATTNVAPMPSSVRNLAARRADGLPVPLTRMVGREQTVATLEARIAQRRFVTVTGPGGIGKTMVASAAAENLSTTYEHGVCFLDLSLVKDPLLLPDTVANALGLGAHPGEEMPCFLMFLKNKSMLIVLDNCEHVVEAVARIAEKILQGAPGVRLLATSREPLRAESEHIYRLPPLDTPDPSVALTRTRALEYPSIQLFIERASAGRDSFEFQDSDVTALTQICYRLDGNPLAIELAAACVDLLGIPELAARLDDCLQLLSRGRRTALPRHQSLRANLDWSYGLLSPLEQAALCCLSIFSGPFDMQSASAAVAEDGDIPVAKAFDALTNLVAKSLLITEMTGERALYRLPHAMRAYALEKLHDGKELARTTLQNAEIWRSSSKVTA